MASDILCEASTILFDPMPLKATSKQVYCLAAGNAFGGRHALSMLHQYDWLETLQHHRFANTLQSVATAGHGGGMCYNISRYCFHTCRWADDNNTTKCSLTCAADLAKSLNPE